MKPREWDLKTDVVVLGSGASGLVAAIVAHDEGSRVTLIEKARTIGGASAVSGGFVWIPNNHLEKEVGLSDSREEALTYMRFIADGRVDDEIVKAFIDNAPVMIRYLEDHAGLRFTVGGYPDFHDTRPGGKTRGRSLAPPTFDANELGEWRGRLRRAPVVILPISWEDYEKSNAMSDPRNLDHDLLAKNMRAGIVGMGMSTIGHLLKACLDRGIEPLMETPGRELVIDDDRVIGVRAEKDGRDFYIRASQGVILASGGFEWSDDLKKRFVPGPDFVALSPPSNEGDGLKMAMAVGAELGNMHEIYGTPCIAIPEEEYEEKPLYRQMMGERSLPHVIMVNRYGKRFVDESFNYSDIAKTFCNVDPVAYDLVNFPAWSVFDQTFKDSYMVATNAPGEPAQDWIIQADTLEELAEKAGIDAGGLKNTIERFNENARKGVDPDFSRGSTSYEKYMGDPKHGPNPALGPIEEPPFYAVSILRGAIGTKGGPNTNVNGQVRHIMGGVIEGLYAVGNVMASTSGPGYGGAGNTIGAGMTWGYIAAKHAAKQPR
jgi:succinate dehydrogenase/fumarate reductase flavoprotein subunit